ncbi:MAG: hypothetical protein HOV77_11845 [Hamadaea sp.]|uniref:hypothetical protein n=1 Tax=Hamadaea sp. TaxID=2024425 RepID=UPI001836D67E|nr:hypothetical protein [Hamadaea sp.]NUT19873.1 hypothetical protein [Hamadaea sp.]
MTEPEQEPFSGSDDGSDDRDPAVNEEIAQGDPTDAQVDPADAEEDASAGGTESAGGIDEDY